jgi:hypothetical protein
MMKPDRDNLMRMGLSSIWKTGAMQVVMTGSASDPPTGSLTSATNPGARRWQSVSCAGPALWQALSR